MEVNDLFSDIRMSNTGSISDELAKGLTHMIFNGDFPPNYMFPNENELCKQLGVGRNSLREAYKILEANGFITRSKRGTFVSDRETVLRGMPIATALKLSKDAQTMEYRTIIEIGIAEYAAQRATEDNLENMRHYIEEMIGNSTIPEKRIYYDFMFHLELAKAGKNDLFITLMQPIREYMLHQNYIEVYKESIKFRTPRAAAHHRNILQAIESQDSEGARKAMSTHMKDHYSYFENMKDTVQG